MNLSTVSHSLSLIFKKRKKNNARLWFHWLFDIFREIPLIPLFADFEVGEMTQAKKRRQTMRTENPGFSLQIASFLAFFL